MIKEGDKVLINRKEYTLGARIDGGLEGSIFNVEKSLNYVIKIISDSKMSRYQRNETYKHLKWLCNLGNRNTEIRQILALPKALLDDRLGYIMSKAGEHDKLEKYLEPPEDMSLFDDWYKKEYTLKKRYQIIVDLFDSLRKIHLAGLVFTDLSPKNVMVHKTQNQIVFIDTDNTRNRMDSYLGVLGTKGYMAPEIYRKPDMDLAKSCGVDSQFLSNCGRITPESDIFSAAIIAFQLITLQHPFIGDEIENESPELEEAALEIKTDYILKKGTNNISTKNLVPQFESLTTKEIRELFYRTFVDGKDNPSLRPTDEEFLEAFQKASDLIVQCPNCGYSRLYTFEEESKCINCENNIGPKIVLVMYNVFKDLKRDELINSIGYFPKLTVDLENLKDIDGNEPSDFFETARIILEPGENHAKYLYLRHFEKNTDRSKAYAKITLSENEESLKVEILNSDVFPNPCLVEKKTMTQRPLGKGREDISYSKYGILFDSKKQGNGFLEIFCRFIKE